MARDTAADSQMVVEHDHPSGVDTSGPQLFTIHPMMGRETATDPQMDVEDERSGKQRANVHWCLEKLTYLLDRTRCHSYACGGSHRYGPHQVNSQRLVAVGIIELVEERQGGRVCGATWPRAGE